jgi:LacI family transcriptional regulator
MTIKDLANIAGVSHSTVSRSLNDSPLISEKTKTRIKELAKEYNFELNASARSLSTRITGTIGIICPEFYDEQRYSFYIAGLLDTVRYKLEEASYDSIITFPQNETTGSSNIKRLITQKKIDGLLLIVPELEDEDREMIHKYSTPHIFLHFKHDHPEDRSAEYIYTDHFKGGYLAGVYMTRTGRGKFCVLTENLLTSEYRERTEGFQAALRDNGIQQEQTTLFTGSCSFEYGYRTVHDHFSAVQECEGIFAHADMVALGAIEALREQGVRVPEDIGVVGYDDIILGNYFRPKLTTIHQPKETQVEKGTKRLFDIINRTEGSFPLRDVVEPILIERESCRGGGK